jgi:hypothetical protein
MAGFRSSASTPRLADPGPIPLFGNKEIAERDADDSRHHERRGRRVSLQRLRRVSEIDVQRKRRGASISSTPAAPVVERSTVRIDKNAGGKTGERYILSYGRRR